MNGEFISIETAERIAKLEKENKKLKKGLHRVINKVCEQDVIIAEAIDKLYCWGEVLQPDFQKIMLNILIGEKNEIRKNRNHS